MWKFLSRRSKECWKSAYAPRAYADQPRHICCYPEAGQCNGKKDNSEEKQGKRTTWEANTPVQPHNWIGALGWSGILVVGWYLSQPSRLRTLLGCSAGDARYKSTVQVLLQSAAAQPLHVLPKALVCGDETPVALDALDQAADSFAQVHGSVENRLGVALAKRKRHKEAVGMFQKAADRGHPTAAFNLGLCHEMGLGTTQDFSKAAECYEVASLGGHATATYNLGVFHVHGWGGKTADCARAKQLFATAARLGQDDARRALGMVDSNTHATPADKTYITHATPADKTYITHATPADKTYITHATSADKTYITHATPADKTYITHATSADKTYITHATPADKTYKVTKLVNDTKLKYAAMLET